MAEWWDEYAEERDPQQDAATEANAVAAQEIGPVDYGYAPPQEIGPVDYGFIPDAPPAAVADALDKRDWLDRGINSFFGGIGGRVGGYLDKKFGTSEEYAAKQADLQSRLAGLDNPAAMYTPHKPRVFGGTLGLIPTALQKMGFDVQDMTPYGFAVMDRDEAAARATSGLPEPSNSSSDDNYIPLGGTPPAALLGPQIGYAPGMGGAAKPVKFRGYPDFTEPNPYG